MGEAQSRQFGSYRVGGPHGPLWRQEQEIPLPPKALAVLWCLIAKAGQIVTKEELLATVWAGTVVGDEAVTSCFRTLRHALEDDAKHPQYIQTVHRIGYRFIAAVVRSQPSGARRKEEAGDWRLETGPSAPHASSLQPPVASLVGRDAELTHLHDLFAKAVTGQRQFVFVTGEAGIGKTALVEAFLHSLQSRGQGQEERQKAKGKRQKAKVGAGSSPQAPSLQPLASPVSFAHGQCIDHYGAGEAYLPVLEAVSRLCQPPEGAGRVEILRRYAPSWLAQLPALLSEAESAALQQQVAGATREQMVREVAEALEVLSADRPLVVVLEDLHWSDVSTLALLSMVARRREAARVLVVATSRPAELVVTNHPLKPLKQELVARGQATEVVLGGLAAAAVQQYVHQRGAERAEDSELAAFVYRRTEGHPLFMVQITDYLVQQSAGDATRPSLLGAVAQAVPTGSGS